MKRVTTKLATAVFIAGLTAAFISPGAYASEKKHISGTEKSKQLISRSMAQPGDAPQHIMLQTVREDTLWSSDADWNDVKALVYEHADQVAGSGVHRGYVTVMHSNGDESYLQYEGTNKIVKGGEAWEIASEGLIKMTGGTGRFKGMKGSGSYKGTTTATGFGLNWEADVQY